MSRVEGALHEALRDAAAASGGRIRSWDVWSCEEAPEGRLLARVALWVGPFEKGVDATVEVGPAGDVSAGVDDDAGWLTGAAASHGEDEAHAAMDDAVRALGRAAEALGDLLRRGPVTPAEVAKGMLAGAVRLGFEPGSRTGTVCWIGDNWFYFDTPEADDMDPGEYAASHDMAATCGLIAEAMSGLDGDERAYYRAVLAEAGCLG